ncbi:MAG: transglycosylase SLT domain-containing protein, partial [Actinobacteria bacterium]|nr:transglycosylase SLT domain-containing protein [Actinomycetota bacterium]
RLGIDADGVVGTRTLAALGLQQRIPTPVTRTNAPPRRYTVRPGESLTAIAQRFRTTIDVLAHLNQLDPAKPLLIGTVLRLPGVVTGLQPASAAIAGVSSVRASLDRWSAAYGVDPHLARALAWMESGFNNAMVSNVGAQGVMQLLPSTWDYVETVLIRRKVAHDADGNVQVGVALLHHLLQAFHGDEKLALAAWYQGERAVKEQGVLKVSRPFVDDVLALRQRM